MNIIAYLGCICTSGHIWGPQGSWGAPLTCEHCGYETKGFAPKPVEKKSAAK